MNLYKLLILFLLLTILPLAQSQEKVYVGSKNSNKYHLKECTGAKRISAKNLISFKSIKEAEEAGYIPCKICSPSIKRSNSNDVKKLKTEPTVKKNKPSYSSGRCQAITKKGTQCKRKAKPGSNYCWQHSR